MSLVMMSRARRVAFIAMTGTVHQIAATIPAFGLRRVIGKLAFIEAKDISMRQSRGARAQAL